MNNWLSIWFSLENLIYFHLVVVEDFVVVCRLGTEKLLELLGLLALGNQLFWKLWLVFLLQTRYFLMQFCVCILAWCSNELWLNVIRPPHDFFDGLRWVGRSFNLREETWWFDQWCWALGPSNWLSELLWLLFYDLFWDFVYEIGFEMTSGNFCVLLQVFQSAALFDSLTVRENVGFLL